MRRVTPTSSRCGAWLTVVVSLLVPACDQSTSAAPFAGPNRNGMPDGHGSTRSDALAPPAVIFGEDARRPRPEEVTDVDAGLCVELADGGWGASACVVCPSSENADAACSGKISKCRYYYGCGVVCACAQTQWSCARTIIACPE